jgi:ABC-2 type transport system permease protein
MLKSVFLKTLKDFINPSIYFAVGIFLISVIVMYVIAEIPLEEFQEILGDLPRIITAFVGGHGGIDLTSVEGVLNTDVFTIIAPLIVIGLGVFSGMNATAIEEERKTLEIILSLPIGRKRFLIEKMLSLIFKVSLIGLIFWMSFLFSALIFDLDLSYFNLAAICFNLSLLGITFGLFSVALGTITSNSNVMFSISSIVAVVSYLIFTLAPLFDKISFTKYFSVFFYYKGSDPLVNGFHDWHWIIFLMLISFFSLFSLIKWEIKDLS